MQVNVNTDNHIAGRDDLSRFVEDVVAEAVAHFGGQVTGVEAHLHDESSERKSGDHEFRCMLEARVAGVKPVAVTMHADNMHLAIKGAAAKLQRTLESTLGRLNDRERRASSPGELGSGVEGQE